MLNPAPFIMEDGTEPRAEYVPAYARSLLSLTGAQLLQRPFPPREMILAPWLPQQGLTMIYADRGIGKTWVGLNVAHSVSCGGSYLGWQAPRLRRVVYIDGEMPGSALKDRYASIVAASDIDPPEDNFRLVASDLQSDGLPDLSDPAHQQYYDDEIRDADLIIVDNLSTVCRSHRENEADSWAPVQAWGLRQRAAGKSVLLIHHAGKSGAQRGTSRKEDVLDSVVSLRLPPDYDANQGARFDVYFTKHRGFFGPDAQPFEAKLIEGRWHTCDIQRGSDEETMRALQKQGLSFRDIAERLGVSKSSVGRKLKGGEA